MVESMAEKVAYPAMDAFLAKTLRGEMPAHFAQARERAFQAIGF